MKNWASNHDTVFCNIFKNAESIHQDNPGSIQIPGSFVVSSSCTLVILSQWAVQSWTKIHRSHHSSWTLSRLGIQAQGGCLNWTSHSLRPTTSAQKISLTSFPPSQLFRTTLYRWRGGKPEDMVWRCVEEYVGEIDFQLIRMLSRWLGSLILKNGKSMMSSAYLFRTNPCAQDPRNQSLNQGPIRSGNFQTFSSVDQISFSSQTSAINLSTS